MIRKVILATLVAASVGCVAVPANAATYAQVAARNRAERAPD
jgi:hypothetical protein